MDQKTRAPRHVPAVHLYPIGICNLAIRISQQGEVKTMPDNELLMALRGIEADADDLHVLLFQVGNVIAKTASLGGATLCVILGVEI